MIITFLLPDKKDGEVLLCLEDCIVIKPLRNRRQSLVNKKCEECGLEAKMKRSSKYCSTNCSKIARKRKMIDRQTKIRKWYLNYKKGLCCKKCGESDYRCLELIRPGHRGCRIYSFIGRNIDKLKVELEKYDCYCANCRYLIDFGDKAYKTRTWFYRFKQSLCCERCGYSNPASLQFHHKNPDDKTCCVGTLVKLKGKNTVFAEVAKCEVVCANCHKKEHYPED